MFFFATKSKCHLLINYDGLVVMLWWKQHQSINKLSSPTCSIFSYPILHHRLVLFRTIVFYIEFKEQVVRCYDVLIFYNPLAISYGHIIFWLTLKDALWRSCTQVMMKTISVSLVYSNGHIVCQHTWIGPSHWHVDFWSIYRLHSTSTDFQEFVNQSDWHPLERLNVLSSDNVCVAVGLCRLIDLRLWEQMTPLVWRWWSETGEKELKEDDLTLRTESFVQSFSVPGCTECRGANERKRHTGLGFVRPACCFTLLLVWMFAAQN